MLMLVTILSLKVAT